MPALRTARWPLVWSYAALVLFAILGRFLSPKPSPVGEVCSAVTILIGCAVLFVPVVKGRRDAWIVLGILAFGASIELIGISTGFPFGSYAYTDLWVPMVVLPVGRFPLLVPFAWLLVAGSSYFSVGGSGWRSALTAGAIGTALDALTERAMTHLNYWRWHDPTPLPGGAPIGNFCAWFVLIAAASVVLARMEPAGDHRPARAVLLGQAALMLALSAT